MIKKKKKENKTFSLTNELILLIQLALMMHDLTLPPERADVEIGEGASPDVCARDITQIGKVGGGDEMLGFPGAGFFGVELVDLFKTQTLKLLRKMGLVYVCMKKIFRDKTLCVDDVEGT